MTKRHLVLWGLVASGMLALLAFSSVILADHESRDCITKSFDCNEQRPDPDPPFCLDPFSPCEGRDQSVCNVYEPTCTGPTGQYPKRVPRTCVNCDPAEREAGGPCNCHHCQFDEVPVVCYVVRPCYWNSSVGACEPATDIVCYTYYTSRKIAPPCVNPEFYPDPNLNPP
ncbi:MAG: hypothetical protein KatS3mg110_0704 [Pirellulaceae bacterium]|nr:MAG: hypothetical protein KatS3mg110_0704 [Pirellulaceae bacterium]